MLVYNLFRAIIVQVPFGEVSVVKEWLHISGHVDKPTNEHPKKVVSGFDCQRKEVSFTRLVWDINQLFGLNYGWQKD